MRSGRPGSGGKHTQSNTQRRAKNAHRRKYALQINTRLKTNPESVAENTSATQ